MSSHSNEQQPPAVEMSRAALMREGVSWILPLAWDSFVNEKSARHPQHFWKKMSQLQQFGLSEGGGPLLHKSTYEMAK
jgi:hypothetical protein